MLPYAAYLRVYEPLTVFPEPARSLWQVYADSPDRPRAVAALEAEHDEALRRLMGRPPMIAPAVESRDAHIRRVGDEVFVCPWQTRLRSWLRMAGFRTTLTAGMRDRFVPDPVVEEAEREFDRWKAAGGSLRTYVRSSTWHVPPAWFVPFRSDERRLSLESAPLSAAATEEPFSADAVASGESSPGAGHRRGDGMPGDGVSGGAVPGDRVFRDAASGEGLTDDGVSGDGPSDDGMSDDGVVRAAPHSDVSGEGVFRHLPSGNGTCGDGVQPPPGVRALRYVTPMNEARPRVEWAVSVLRTGSPGPADTAGPGSGDGLDVAEVAAVGEWLAGFHPGSLVELDYGGLVHLLGDQALRTDQSAAEVSAGLTALHLGQAELAVAMYRRLHARWRPVQALAAAN